MDSCWILGTGKRFIRKNESLLPSYLEKAGISGVESIKRAGGRHARRGLRTYLPARRVTRAFLATWNKTKQTPHSKEPTSLSLLSPTTICFIMKPIGDDAFIIMSGPPEKGKRERISKVRSHIKKGYFERKLEGKKCLERTQNKKSAFTASHLCSESPTGSLEKSNSTLPGHVLHTWLPIANVTNTPNHAYFMPESTRRVQKCEWLIPSKVPYTHVETMLKTLSIYVCLSLCHS